MNEKEVPIIISSLEFLVDQPNFKRHNARLFLGEGDLKLNFPIPEIIDGILVNVLSTKELEELVKRLVFLRFFTINEPLHFDDSIRVTINHWVLTKTEKYLAATDIANRYLNEIEIESLNKLCKPNTNVSMNIQYTLVDFHYDTKTQSYERTHGEVVSYPPTH